VLAVERDGSRLTLRTAQGPTQLAPKEAPRAFRAPPVPSAYRIPARYRYARSRLFPRKSTRPHHSTTCSSTATGTQAPATIRLDQRPPVDSRRTGEELRML